MVARHWTAEERIRIVMEALNTDVTLAELCRKYNQSKRILSVEEQACRSRKDGTIWLIEEQ
jgi:transposase-like protein